VSSDPQAAPPPSTPVHSPARSAVPRVAIVAVASIACLAVFGFIEAFYGPFIDAYRSDVAKAKAT